MAEQAIAAVQLRAARGSATARGLELAQAFLDVVLSDQAADGPKQGKDRQRRPDVSRFKGGLNDLRRLRAQVRVLL